jgi:exodeoxyribonuclease-3
MKIVSWNVNGYRAILGKGFTEWFNALDADVVGLQEVKAHKEAVTPAALEYAGYECYWHAAKKPGYSGTALWTRVKPVSYREGFGIEKFDNEGRVQILEFKDFYLLNCYFPNSQDERARLDYKLEFLAQMQQFCDTARKKKKGVIVQGDINIAHTEIDLKNPKTNQNTAGYYIEERDWMTSFLKSGMRDIFRDKNPGKLDQYTWWSYRMGARGRNVGWRIDAHLISPDLVDRVKDTYHLREVMGSDHCPIVLEID